MSTEQSVVLITALVRANMEGYVIRALHDLAHFPGITRSEVRGQGVGRGKGGAYVSTDLDLTFQQHVELRVICPGEQVDGVCDTIAAAAWTGNKGDGVIWTTPISTFATIREAGAQGRHHA